MRLKVLGIGSPFGVDRIGWDVVEALGARHPHSRYALGELRIGCCDRPGVALLEQLRDCDEAWIVDALAGGRVGHLRWLVPEDLGLAGESFSTHGAGVADALALGAALNEPLPAVRLLAIEAGCKPEAELPQACVARALDELSMRLRDSLGEPLL
ncbi:MAG: hydrogenase maturation protease [Acidihalobacter sp.]|uniref:hydrogenase maturation protease n=1 Tax=Acidihalobacter sp. TaxID=1872108 RepID=UPI00307D0627